MEKVIRSPISYWGNKRHHVPQILPYFPQVDSKTIYIEMFCGSSILFFNYQAQQVVLNDINKNLINFWNVIRNQCSEFEKELEYIWPSNSIFDEFRARQDPVGRAVFFYLVNRNSFCGLNDSDKFRYTTSSKKVNKDFTFWSKCLNNCRSLSIWELDFREVFEKLENFRKQYRSIFIYIDPPYIADSKYIKEFSKQDHTDLCKILHDSQHHIILSYGDNEWVRNNYKDWNIIKLNTFHTSKITLKKDMKEEQKTNELLLSNRPFIKYTKEKNANSQMKVI